LRGLRADCQPACAEYGIGLIYYGLPFLVCAWWWSSYGRRNGAPPEEGVRRVAIATRGAQFDLKLSGNLIGSTIWRRPETHFSALSFDYRSARRWLKYAILKKHNRAVTENVDRIMPQFFYTIFHFNRGKAYEEVLARR